MGKKLTWFESYTTICKYSTSLTDEQAEQFEQDPDAFLADFDYQADQDLEWDKIKNEEEDNELLLKRLENYFEEAKKNDQIDYIDKKLLGFFAEEVQEISNFEENKITQSNEKTEIKTDSNSKLHKLINE